jgi:hypothetical protein
VRGAEGRRKAQEAWRPCDVAWLGVAARVPSPQNGLLVCSAASAEASGCRLGGNLYGDVSVGGHDTRCLLSRCHLEWNPTRGVRVQMAAQVRRADAL